jgi:hypothetical protein
LPAVRRCFWAGAAQRQALRLPVLTPPSPRRLCPAPPAQVFFSARCPLIRSGLSLAQRLWYTYGTWSYFCTICTLPTFIVVPFLSLLFGLHPVVVDRWFAISGTAYYVSIYLVQNYCRCARCAFGAQPAPFTAGTREQHGFSRRLAAPATFAVAGRRSAAPSQQRAWHKHELNPPARRDFAHLRSLWYVNVSQTVLWFTYCKAVFNTLLSQLNMKVLAFKATVKKVGKP